jgi:hypothetical protein
LLAKTKAKRAKKLVETGTGTGTGVRPKVEAEKGARFFRRVSFRKSSPNKILTFFLNITTVLKFKYKF